MAFLQDATLATTVGWLAETARYLIGVVRP
jgi:hypothetical protein